MAATRASKNLFSALRIFILLAAVAVPCSLAQTTPENTIRPVDEEATGACVNLTQPGCSAFGYPLAYFPNFRQHADPAEASSEFSDFDLLLNSGCHDDVRQFFCSFYYPLCYEKGAEACFLKPCRSLCLAVRGSCEQSLINAGFSWPVFLDCDLNSTFSEDSSCFGPPQPTISTSPTATTTESTSTPVTTLTPSPPTRPPTTQPPPVCESITTDYCMDIGYNSTSFERTNLAEHSTQVEAIRALRNFNVFISSKCSDAIVHFLCLFYIPECGAEAVLDPCSELCSFVESECLTTFQDTGIPWDNFFNCRDLPSRFEPGARECSGPLDPASVSIPMIPGLTDLQMPGRNGAPSPVVLSSLFVWALPLLLAAKLLALDL